MVLKIDEPIMESMDSLDINYTSEELHYEVIKEMVMCNHRCAMNQGNQSIVVESVTDFFDKMAEYFRQLIKKIKEFFSKVMMYINAYIQDLDKFCAQYKDKLNALNPKFTFSGHVFTIDDNLPIMTEFEKIVNDYNSSISVAKELTKDDIKKEHQDFLRTSNLDSLRGRVLGANKSITEENFSDEVLKTFRNGSIDTVDIEVDSSYVREIVSTAKSLVDAKKKCERDKQTLLVLLTKTENFFSKKINIVYKDLHNSEIRMSSVSTNDNKFSVDDERGVQYTESTSNALAELVKYKYSQVKNISGMINTVMYERVNSYKMHVKQNSQILRRALINKEGDTK